jgi:ATP-dependent Lon protease
LSKQIGTNDFQNIPNAEITGQGLIELPVVPLRGQLVFPAVVTPIAIRSPRALAALQVGLKERRTVLAIAQRDSTLNDAMPPDLYTIGTEIALGKMLRAPDGSRNILAQGRRRVEVVEVLQTSPYILVRARPLVESRRNEDESYSLLEKILRLLQRLADLNPAIPDDVLNYIADLNDPPLVADLIAASLILSVEDRQELLEIGDADKRLQEILALLGQELSVLELRDEISSQVQQEMDRSQRESYLREQMRVIQNELGESDIFQQDINEIQEQILEAHLPEDIQDKALKEISRLMMMPPMAPEVGIIRSYIDWLTGLPWNKQTDDDLDVLHAQKILDADHYGLPKVKDRILEYIAVRKLAASKMKSPILCFVGPPGVGKTSLGKSIARALGREFVRVSLGGVRDEAEIRGHRRTYIGALPGRIIQTMRRAGTVNPVFILDEIDKLGMDFRGDPSSALLEVLDPEQNNSFSDHYLEVPYDLSKVLFITTANDLDPVPDALLDRLEIIEFSGYIEEEKLAISRQFLIPNQLEAHGLSDYKVTFETRALQTLIREYTYEGGVRNLNREIANVCRKVARLIAEERPYPKRVTAPRIGEYLGPPLYTRHRVHDKDTVGLATGLVWTYDGGDIAIIEASVLFGKGTLLLTGQLGEVMQESAQTALSYMRSRAKDFDVPGLDFEEYDVHIHLPEGAVPKEGPSAGITLAIAIISAFTERKVRSDYAMTGEITLRGKVLPVGGVKEKVLAGYRAGIKNIILPAENQKDLIDVPKEALKNLNIIHVSDMQEVIDRVLLPPPAQRQRDLDREEEEKDEKEKTGRKKKHEANGR